MRQPPLFPPAGKDDPNPDWAYSNTNYIVAGMVIEKVTGRDWRKELRDRVLRPLGLTNTYAPGDDPWLPRPYARTYKRFPESRDTGVAAPDRPRGLRVGDRRSAEPPRARTITYETEDSGAILDEIPIGGGVRDAGHQRVS